jgi:hypothetical protein
VWVLLNLAPPQNALCKPQRLAQVVVLAVLH